MTDAARLAPLVEAEVRHARAIAAYYRLATDFDWLGYARSKIARSDGCALLAETPSGAAVGFIELSLRRVAEAPDRRDWRRWFKPPRPHFRLPLAAMCWGWIDACYVDEIWRGQGVGATLVGAAFDWFRKHEVDRVELAALADGDARLFWERCGFRVFRLGMSRDLGGDRA